MKNFLRLITVILALVSFNKNTFLEKEYIKTYKHKYQNNRDIAHAKVLACHKEIIEILKSNYDKFS